MNTAPIYYRSAQYAREHGELDQYRETAQLCRICKKDIETILSARFDGMRLEHVAIDEALAIHGPELIGLLLATTVTYKAWDGRFSRSNKEWARTVRKLDREPDCFYAYTIIDTHSAILDGFVTMYRKATA